MPSSIYFRGQNLYDPQTVVDVNNLLLNPDNLGSKNLAVVGYFPWLEPHKLHVFRSTGGPSVEEVYPNISEMQLLDYMWKNSIKDSRQVSTSLSYVNAADSTSNVQASAMLQSRLDDPGTAAIDEEYFGAQADVLEIKSTVWGNVGNLQTAEIVQNYDADPDFHYMLKYNELGLPPQEIEIGSGRILSIQSSVAGTMTLSRSSGARDIVWTESGQAAVNISLADFETLQSLADRMNLLNGLTVEVLNFDYTPDQLDAFDYEWQAGPVANVREANYTQLYTLNGEAFTYAHVQALHDIINTLTSVKLSASILLRDSNLAAQSAVTAGGSNGSLPDASDYESALAAIVDKDLQLVCALLPDDDALRRAVAGKMKVHIEESLDASRDRQAWMPCDQDVTIDNAHDLYVRPNTNVHLQFVAQGMLFDNAPINKMETLGNEYMAFMLMCMQGALPYAEPLTRKRPNILNTSESWDRDDRKNKNKAIRKNLVIVSSGLNNELYVNRGVTSWIKDNDTINAEISSRESVLGCARFVRLVAEREIGGRILLSTKDSLKKIINDRLKELKEIAMIKDFGGVAVNIVDDTAFVEFDIAPVNPLNFIRITLNVVRNP